MRYHAYRLPDLAPLHGAVEMRGVTLYRAVNEPGELRGSLDKAQAYEEMTVEGEPETVRLMRDHGTLLVADDGSTARAFIVDLVTQDAEHQDRLIVSSTGFGYLPSEQPWLGPHTKYIQEDPLNIVRAIWAYISGRENSLPVSVADTRSPVRIGEQERPVNFTTGDGEEVDFDAGPERLVWYNADDLLKRIDDLATETPFEWREVTHFNRDNDDPPQLHIDLGYPRLEATVRDTLKFTVGTNVTAPQFEDEEDWFSEVLVLGNGEGQAKRRGRGYRKNPTRLMRVKVIEDNSLMSNNLCRRVAQDEADRADRADPFIESCTVVDHQAAPLGSFDIGDTITIQGSFTWGDHSQDCRVHSIEHNLSENTMALTLERLPE